MTKYQLNHLEGGIVRLASGGWQWYVIRLNSLPENACQLQQLIFVSTEDGGGIMCARVPNDLDEIGEAAIKEAAKQPEYRRFNGPKGWVTVRPPLDRSFGAMWSIWPDEGTYHRTDYAIEKELGELTREDMRVLAR